MEVAPFSEEPGPAHLDAFNSQSCVLVGNNLRVNHAWAHAFGIRSVSEVNEANSICICLAAYPGSPHHGSVCFGGLQEQRYGGPAGPPSTMAARLSLHAALVIPWEWTNRREAGLLSAPTLGPNACHYRDESSRKQEEGKRVRSQLSIPRLSSYVSNTASELEGAAITPATIRSTWGSVQPNLSSAFASQLDSTTIIVP